MLRTKMKESIVLYPAPGLHHLVSMVELGKLILRHHPYLCVTILVTTTTPLDAPATSSYVHTLSQSDLPVISFLAPPSVDVPQSLGRAEAAFESIRLNASIVVDALATISLTSTVLALVTSAVYGSYHHRIPTYFYFTSSAAVLAVILCLPTLHDRTTRSFRDMGDTLLHFPGLPHLKGSDMPDALLDRESPAYRFFLNMATWLPRSKGIIVNTFDSLEPRAIEAIVDGACVPLGATPPLYRIGPLTVDAKDTAVGYLRDAAFEHCLAWLDLQPQRSVVLLCFGSRGTFSKAQLKEMAAGLERSDQRFLWVVRSPPNSSTSEPDLDALLPQGFAERTKERGLVVKSWAPQSAILRHESVGGFVTHCGWKSVLEAVSCGVPMLAWPLYAEQQVNRVVLVEEMKLAIPIEKASEEELVTAEELEKKVRVLMECGSEEGKGIRERSLSVKAMATAAWTNGGSSFASFSEMIASWKQGYADARDESTQPEDKT